MGACWILRVPGPAQQSDASATVTTIDRTPSDLPPTDHTAIKGREQRGVREPYFQALVILGTEMTDEAKMALVLSPHRVGSNAQSISTGQSRARR